MLRSEFEERATRKFNDVEYNDIEFVYNWYPSDNMDMDCIAYIFNRLGIGAVRALLPRAREYYYLKKNEEEVLRAQIDISARIGEVYNK